jgi:hypothetical protein
VENLSHATDIFLVYVTPIPRTNIVEHESWKSNTCSVDAEKTCSLSGFQGDSSKYNVIDLDSPSGGISVDVDAS